MKKKTLLLVALMSMVSTLTAAEKWVEIPVKNAKFANANAKGNGYLNWRMHEVDMVALGNGEKGVGVPKQKMTKGPFYSALKQIVWFDTPGKYKKYHIVVIYKTDDDLKDKKKAGGSTNPDTPGKYKTRVVLRPVNKEKKTMWAVGSEGASGKLKKSKKFKKYKYLMRANGKEDGLEICFDSNNPDYRAVIKEVQLFGVLAAPKKD